jgi:hypothetical protein
MTLVSTSNSTTITANSFFVAHLAGIGLETALAVLTGTT